MFKPKILRSINYFLFALAIAGPVWFFASIYSYNSMSKDVINKLSNIDKQMVKVGEADKDVYINWETLIPSFIAFITFLLKYYWYDRKTKTYKPILDETHPLFSELEQSLFNIKNITFGNEGRTEMFRLMLTEQYNIFAEYARKFLSANYEFKSPVDFRNQCRQLIVNIIKAYEERWSKLGVPQIVIDKIRDLYQGRIQLILSDIDTIAFYRAEDNYEEALFFILTSILFMLKFGITIDSIKLLKELNGELKSYKFNNKDLS